MDMDDFDSPGPSDHNPYDEDMSPMWDITMEGRA